MPPSRYQVSYVTYLLRWRHFLYVIKYNIIYSTTTPFCNITLAYNAFSPVEIIA